VEQMGELRPVSRVVAPVREQLLQMMREAIVTGQWKPGERLVERELCEGSGASRSSVREALRQLESEGLVTVVPNKGPIVSVLSEQQVIDIYELRVALGSFMVASFCERASDEQITALRECFTRMEAASASQDFVEALHATEQFHDILLDGACNSALSDALNRLHSLISFLRARSMSTSEFLPVMLEENRAVLNAASARDAADAVRAMERHIGAARQRVVSSINSQQSQNLGPS
jgi:GntR family transcriptional regulator, trigonelline degradation regulator